MRRPTAFACPLRVGSGVKNKILAAMAMQKATVATSMSIDGLDLADNREVLLADDPQDLQTKSYDCSQIRMPHSSWVPTDWPEYKVSTPVAQWARCWRLPFSL